MRLIYKYFKYKCKDVEVKNKTLEIKTLEKLIRYEIVREILPDERMKKRLKEVGSENDRFFLCKKKGIKQAMYQINVSSWGFVEIKIIYMRGWGRNVFTNDRHINFFR
ncbi:MAG: hypothetical protein N2645_18375 [Clostridia bacterium]|nr:hypothetical protein [Clostridia bacterium]